MKSFTTTIGLNINEKSFKSNEENEEKENEENKNFYDIPWNLSTNYSLTYNKGYNIAKFADTTQSLTFSGNLKLNKIGGFDLDMTLMKKNLIHQ